MLKEFSQDSRRMSDSDASSNPDSDSSESLTNPSYFNKLKREGRLPDFLSMNDDYYLKKHNSWHSGSESDFTSSPRNLHEYELRLNTLFGLGRQIFEVLVATKMDFGAKSDTKASRPVRESRLRALLIHSGALTWGSWKK